MENKVIKLPSAEGTAKDVIEDIYKNKDKVNSFLFALSDEDSNLRVGWSKEVTYEEGFMMLRILDEAIMDIIRSLRKGTEAS